MYLEQMILKNNAHEKALNIVEMHEGLDFQYRGQAHANRLINFVQQNLVCRHRLSRSLISHDEQNDVYKNKCSTVLELAPICKDDLVILPPKL